MLFVFVVFPFVALSFSTLMLLVGSFDLCKPSAVKMKVMGVNKAARTYSVPKATLLRHIKQVNVHAPSGDKSLGRSPDLPRDVENDLVQHILLLEARFYGLTRDSLLRLAYQLAKANGIKTRFNDQQQKAGKEWLPGFLTRHPDISLRIPESTSLARAAGFNRQRVGKFFQLLQKIAQEENLTSEKIFNVDETGFSAVQKPQKVFARRGKHQVGAITSCERGRNVTFVCCVNASGRYIPPLVIYPRKNLKMELTEGAPPGSIFGCQENGWINCDLFRLWFEHFLTTVQPSIENKVLLILDGHATHTQNIQVILRAREKGVIMLSLPPHCSHRLQPLDLTFFKPLSCYYSQCIDTWMRSNPGLPVTEQKVTKFFGEAYSKAACIATAVNGFQKAGIWPVNAGAIRDEEFAPSDVTEKPAPDNQSCVAAPLISDNADIQGQRTVELVIDNDDGTSSIVHLPIETAPCEVNDTLMDTETAEQPACQSDRPMPIAESEQISPQLQDGRAKLTDERVSACMLSPIPVRQSTATSSRKRRVGLGATILTASPYKQSLEEKVKNKEADSKSRKVCPGEKKKKQKVTGIPKLAANVKTSRKTTSRAQLKPPKPANERTVIPRKPVWLENYNRQHQGQL